MKILFLGPAGGTAQHRAKALARLGHQVRIVNPDDAVPQGRLSAKLHYETGGLLCERRVMSQVLQKLRGERFDLTWVDGGRYVGPRLVEALRSYGPVVNYNHDDPFGRRDRCSWLLYRRAISAYDLMVVVRQPNVKEACALGAKAVRLIVRPADEVAHAPRKLTPADHERWDSEVVFVGTWMPERGPFMAELIERGVPLTIYGNLWQRSREWPSLRKAWKGPGTTSDDDYAKAIQCAKICLGLLSRGNRDLHTTRSTEVPCLGGLLCAERTQEHLQLYTEGEEAVFWSDAAECAIVCKRLLEDRPTREEISRQGRTRCLRNGHLNEAMLTHVLAEVTC